MHKKPKAKALPCPAAQAAGQQAPSPFGTLQPTLAEEFEKISQQLMRPPTLGKLLQAFADRLSTIEATLAAMPKPEAYDATMTSADETLVKAIINKRLEEIIAAMIESPEYREKFCQEKKESVK